MFHTRYFNENFTKDKLIDEDCNKAQIEHVFAISYELSKISSL